jgi:hypothetical protein
MQKPTTRESSSGSIHDTTGYIKPSLQDMLLTDITAEEYISNLSNAINSKNANGIYQLMPLEQLPYKVQNELSTISKPAMPKGDQLIELYLDYSRQRDCSTISTLFNYCVNARVILKEEMVLFIRNLSSHMLHLCIKSDNEKNSTVARKQFQQDFSQLFTKLMRLR